MNLSQTVVCKLSPNFRGSVISLANLTLYLGKEMKRFWN